MKKRMLIILFCGILLLGITGCSSVSKDELNKVNDTIIDYFKVNGVNDYQNVLFNYVDEDNEVVVVGLLKNSKEEQEKFKQTIVDSNLIKFVKGSQLVNDNLENEKTFIRTYNVLDIAKSNEEKYVYLTIRQFQSDEVQTVKVDKSLCPNIKVGKNYEFTIKTNKKLEDNILSIFTNSEIIEIKETKKIGLDQTQEPIN